MSERFMTKGSIDIKAECLNSPSYEMINFSIGCDDHIYCLLAQEIYLRPELLGYHALVFNVDWFSGDVYWRQNVEFGILPKGFAFIQPIRNSFLLVAAEGDALVIDAGGTVCARFRLGADVCGCVADAQHTIWTRHTSMIWDGYNDWDGIIKWSEKGVALKAWEAWDRDGNPRYTTSDFDNIENAYASRGIKKVWRDGEGLLYFGVRDSQ